MIVRTDGVFSKKGTQPQLKKSCKFFFAHFLFVNKSKVIDGSSKNYENHFSYIFIFEASLNSVHFPILAYILRYRHKMTISPY